MPGSTGPGCVRPCGEPGEDTGSFCEACGTELASLPVSGCGRAGASHDDGDTPTATLGHAGTLAKQSGNEDTAKLHAKAVEAASSTVRLQKKVEDANEMTRDNRSAKTARTRK